jgi:hypothetical protein
VTTLYSLVGTPINSELTVSENNFNMLTQSCCKSLGYHYGSTDRSIFNLNGTITYIPIDQESSDLLKELNTTQGCFICPTDYKETVLIGLDGNTIITVTDTQGNEISESCCNNLGYSYTTLSNYSNTPLCLKCTTTPVVSLRSNEVLNSNGTPLSEECCLQNGYYYYSGSETKTGCYICPPLVEGNYLINVTTINTQTYTVITDSNNETLSPKCCGYYAKQSNNTDVVYANGVGCIII